MLKITMKPTGWFHVAWSAEIAPGAVKPMKYFGQDLVAFRSAEGKLAILDAHCKHLGAHLAYGGKVKNGCIQCPYHGWQWDSEGHNTLVPYQEEPTRAKLRSWSVVEKHGMVFMWHDPAGGAPREGWDLPDLFKDFESFPDFTDASSNEADYYPCYPDAVVFKPGEPIPPQMVVENAPDTSHFHFTHGTPECPELEFFDTSSGMWKAEMAFKSPKTKQKALRFLNICPNIALSYTVFHGRDLRYRLILSATPIDDQLTDFRVSYFFPRDPQSPEIMPESVRTFAAQTVELFEQDARMWRHQVFVSRPVFSRQDIAGYTALRKWSERFYETTDDALPIRAVETL